MSGFNFNLLSAIVDAADGKIVGRIRLQKIVYLLERLGLNGGFAYSYHHYGPYSEDVASSVDFAKFIDGSIIEESGRTAYGNPFSIYKSKVEGGARHDRIGDLEFERVRELIARMKRDQSVVIELAATIIWLKVDERVDDWRSELKRRKPSKATDGSIALAERLLADIGLSN